MSIRRLYKDLLTKYLFQIDENSVAARTKMADKLRSDIAEGKAEGERRIYIVFPNIKEHRNHAVYYVSRITNVFYKPKFICCFFLL